MGGWADATLALANSASLLLLAALAHSGLIGLARRHPPLGSAPLRGLFFGAVAVLCMLTPLVVAPGLLLDLRVVPVALAGPFGGVIAGLVAVLPPIAYRAWLGGPGMAIGIAAILVAAAAGIGAARLAAGDWRRAMRPAVLEPRMGWVPLLALALLLPPGSFALMLAGSVPWTAPAGVAVTLVLPGAVIALGGLLLLDGQRRRLERRLAEGEHDLAVLLAKAPGVFFRYRLDAAGRVACPLVGGRTAELLGLPAADAAERLFDQLDADDRRSLLGALQRARRDGAAASLDVRFLPASGGPKWLHVEALPTASGAGAGCGFVTDVTERKRSELALLETRDRLARLARTDELTGIPNRRALDERLAASWREAAREGKPLSLALADVDHFKQYNDKLGHGAGDACLAAVARTMAGAARRPGDMAARHGGEEFALLMPATPEPGAMALAELVRALVEALPHPDAPGGKVTVSLGFATARPRPAEDPARGIAALLADADASLYAAKAAGRNRVCAAPARVMA
jgi:diguanylate cyclase (GGDEF)-like protein